LRQLNATDARKNGKLTSLAQGLPQTPKNTRSQQEPIVKAARLWQGGFDERSERKWLRENALQEPATPSPMRSMQRGFAIVEQAR
jgi:hypothetical protein